MQQYSQYYSSQVLPLQSQYKLLSGIPPLQVHALATRVDTILAQMTQPTNQQQANDRRNRQFTTLVIPIAEAFNQLLAVG